MSDLARALLDELAADPVALDRLRELVAVRDEKPPPPVPALVTVAGAAKMLGVSARTVRRRIDDGTLPAVVEHGRTMVRADELRAYVGNLDRPGDGPTRRRRTRSARGRFDFLRG